MSRRSSAVALTLLFALTPAWAEAAPPKGDQGQALVGQAVEAYRGKRFKEAGDLFLAAYQKSGVPTQIRNAAKAYQDGEQYEDAERAWTRFKEHHGVSKSEIAEADAQLALIAEKRRTAEAALETERAKKDAEASRIAKEAAEAAAAKDAEEARLARARAEEAEREKAAAPPPPPPALLAPAPEPATPLAPWLTIGAGAAVAIGGTVFLVHSSTRLSSLDEQLAMKDGQGRITGTSPTAAQAELDGINTERWIGGVALGVGAAALSLGVLWLILSASDS